MRYFELTISSSEGEIKLGTKVLDDENDAVLTDIKVSFDTLDDDVNQKSNAMLARIEVSGPIRPNNTDALSKIVNWTKDFSPTAYRNLKIVVYDDEKTILRTYEIDEVFVCDYDESYGSEDGKSSTSSTYVLKMTQKQNKLKSIKIY